MFGNENETVLAYVYDRDGKYAPPIRISSNPEQVASFLVMTRYASKVMVTNDFDEMQLTTLMGGFIDRCNDQEYLREKLLPILVPMQLGEVKPKPLQNVQWDWSPEEIEHLGGEEGLVRRYNEQLYTDIEIKTV